MDVITLFFAVILSLLLTKYLPPHTTYQNTVNEIKDEIQKAIAKLMEFGGSLKGLREEIAAELQGAANEIKNIKDQESGSIKEEVQRIAAKLENFGKGLEEIKKNVSESIQKATSELTKLGADKGAASTDEIQKLSGKLSELSSGLDGLKKEVEDQLQKALNEIEKIETSGPPQGTKELEELSQKISHIEQALSGEVKKITEEINQIKAQNEVLTGFVKESQRAYLPEQFDLYNGLWVSLVELKTIVGELWEFPSREKAKKLAKQVLETRKMLEQSAIFIPEKLFNELTNIINEFENIQFGKLSLIKLRNVSVKNKDFAEKDLKSGLESNISIKDKFFETLEEFKQFIKKQVLG